MRHLVGLSIAAALMAAAALAAAQAVPTVVDIATRPGVRQRLLVLAPPQARAAVVLFAGGHGGLQIQPDGTLRWGAGNFLVRTPQLFADQGLAVVLVDAPSDRQGEPFLGAFRQSPEHTADVKAVIAWPRARSDVPMWRVATSRGTRSVAYVATELSGHEGPDGIVLTSSILSDRRSRPAPAIPLEKIRVPVLVVHHEEGRPPALLVRADPVADETGWRIRRGRSCCR